MVSCQYADGASYRGTVSVTKTGKTCQRWDSQTPHEHTRTHGAYPSAGLEQNYCRNPDGEPRVWCYTTDPNSRWELCDVPSCVSCQYADGASYRGTVSVTNTGKTCQRWDSQTPHEHIKTPDVYPLAGLERNYCRNPDGELGVWCYTTDPNSKWELCDVPSCARPCQHGWSEHNNHCYKLMNEEVSFSTANQRCKGMGANLASIRDGQENNFIASIISHASGDMVWIGLKYNKWMDGSEFSYRNWAPGQPDDHYWFSGGEKCVVIYKKTPARALTRRPRAARTPESPQSRPEYSSVGVSQASPVSRQTPCLVQDVFLLYRNLTTGIMPGGQQQSQTGDTGGATPEQQDQTNWRSLAHAAATIPNALYVSRADYMDRADNKLKKCIHLCKKFLKVTGLFFAMVSILLFPLFAGVEPAITMLPPPPAKTVPVLSQYAASLENHVKKRYVKKISVIDIDPVTEPSDQFDTQCLPPVEQLDLFSYLVLETSHYTNDQFKNYKSLEAYNHVVWLSRKSDIPRK
ncbi:hypothetical protein Bbelb_133710 [Branchiostoma belcheri]|nr:hypothetical protein Bbelb_133710 [Branchiostoma belcheri]